MLAPFQKIWMQLLSVVHKTARVCQSNSTLPNLCHQEIEDILVLKNNKGIEDNRVRKLDYSIQLSKLFYERFINNEDITLFSPHEAPELYEPKHRSV